MFGEDHNTNMKKTEEDKSKYRIHKATVESYKGRPYEFTVLKDLIEGKRVFCYCKIIRFILFCHINNIAPMYIIIYE